VVYTAAGLATPPVRWFVSPSSAARAVASLARGGPLTGVVDAPPGAGSTAYAIEPLRRALADAWRDVWTRVDAAGERDTAERLAARLHRLGSSEQLDPSPSEALRGASGLTGEVVRELGDDAEHVRSPLFAHSSTETGGHLLAVLLQRVLGTGSPVLAAAGTLATHAGPAWPFVDVLVCTARPA
jgi:hypothetical protein